jgi:hypothetical protein
MTGTRPVSRILPTMAEEPVPIYPTALHHAARLELLSLLELFASTELQRDYQGWMGVVTNATKAMLTRWMQVTKPGLDSLSDVLTQRELSALKSFDKCFRLETAGIRDEPPQLVDLWETPERARLQTAAAAALPAMEPYRVPELPDQEGRGAEWKARHQKYLSGREPDRCPCCCYRTRADPGSYCICPICFWEDDGQDEPEADKVWGGPNGDVSLTQGRQNFIRYGAAEHRTVSAVRAPRHEEL